MTMAKSLLAAPELVRARLAVCAQCPQLRRPDGKTAQCAVCLCFVRLKARVPGQQCPLKLW